MGGSNRTPKFARGRGSRRIYGTGGARRAVPSTMNVSGMDEHPFSPLPGRGPYPRDWASKAFDQMPREYRSMGGVWIDNLDLARRIQTGARPRLGSKMRGDESNAICVVREFPCSGSWAAER